MPRKARIDIPGALHHIICRGIERRKIFRDDVDRDDFLARLISLATRTSTRCYAWALLPNHFHLLLKTGLTPISLLMQRLLTGYATSFNRRHRRVGHLFQNRYKSILCQEEPYLLELIRYIHLNPLRAGVVSSPEALKAYRYCGHSWIMEGNPKAGAWMGSEEVLGHFSDSHTSCLLHYESFVCDGIAQGRRPQLTGGGLVRSAGGWHEIKSAKESGMFLKSDERVLGDSDFVEMVLASAEEGFDRKTRNDRDEVDLNKLLCAVAVAFGIGVEEMLAGRQPQRVQARSLVCYWAFRELGITATALAARFGVTQPAITLAVARGEGVAKEKGWVLREVLTRNL